jgi:hypothetical protein
LFSQYIIWWLGLSVSKWMVNKQCKVVGLFRKVGSLGTEKCFLLILTYFLR